MEEVEEIMGVVERDIKEQRLEEDKSGVKMGREGKMTKGDS